MLERSVDRRDFLKTLGSASVVVGGAVTVGGCSNGSTGKSSNGSGGQAAPKPTYIERQVAKPELPALKNGTPAGYLRYPASPQKLSSQPPGTGSTISVLKAGDTPLPSPVDKNPYWQELNRRAGCELKINQVANDYGTKVATTLAGGDLPDLMMMFPMADMAGIFEAKFQDLSPWLAGDKISAYPNLASRPAWGWNSLAINGGIWGVPWCFSSLAANEIRYRQDLFSKRGLSVDLTSGQDLLELCKQLTDQKKGMWAFGDLTTTPVEMVKEMVGVPNQWRVSDSGSFTADVESDEYPRMLEIVAQLWKSGYVYPDIAGGLVQSQQLFIEGKSGLIRQAYTNWPSVASRGEALNASFQQESMVLPKWEGGGQSGHFTNDGTSGFLALKKAPKERIEELLRVLDWFAAPFGSEEYLFIQYGIPGRDYTLDGTDPVSTPTGINECRNMFMTYMAGAPLPLYTAQQPKQTQAQYDGISRMMETTVPMPTAGLYSEKALTKGQTINKNMKDLQTEILLGRTPISAWADGVKAWRSGGGDEIRAEYEALHAAR